MTNRRRFLTKADIWLIFIVIAASLFILLIFRLIHTQGSYARVSYDGMEIARIPLMQTTEKYYILRTNMQSESNNDVCGRYSIEEFSATEWADMLNTCGSLDSLADMQFQTQDYNIMLYKNGKVWMLMAGCPDQICVHHRDISAVGESIICLPHKVVIDIIDGKAGELDGVAY